MVKKNLKCSLRNVIMTDCGLLFKWANDMEVRKNSFNTEPISYKEHIEWFGKKLQSADTFMYILVAGNEDIGVIRLDRIEDEVYLINYSIAEEYRGLGYATHLLELIKEKYKLSLLVGKVKAENIGSIKAFLKAGYLMEDKHQIKIFYSSDKKIEGK